MIVASSFATMVEVLNSVNCLSAVLFAPKTKAPQTRNEALKRAGAKPYRHTQRNLNCMREITPSDARGVMVRLTGVRELPVRVAAERQQMQLPRFNTNPLMLPLRLIRSIDVIVHRFFAETPVVVRAPFFGPKWPL